MGSMLATRSEVSGPAGLATGRNSAARATANVLDGYHSIQFIGRKLIYPVTMPETLQGREVHGSEDLQEQLDEDLRLERVFNRADSTPERHGAVHAQATSGHSDARPLEHREGHPDEHGPYIA
ncbi:MAG: hypothetical protein M1840_002208 [Geoglossum simile]|nr:MAG: hypothetical protein M1840_002208 [Geoglossum simile]